jgi:oligoribonuclease NrnB/cAMP/cGMP phosphodiesterase (DHH superfamily)
VNGKMIKLFSHTDLDGVGCAVIANHVFGEDNVSVTYCDYAEVNRKVTEFIKSGAHENYRLVFITDISVDEDTAMLIEEINSAREGQKFTLIDHHATAMWMNATYPWALVMPEHANAEGTKACGTDLFLLFLGNTGAIESSRYEQLYQFAECVRRWDTWDWKNVYGGEELPKRLNNLLYLVGRKPFLARFTSDISLAFTEGEELVLTLEEVKIENYIKKVGKTIAVKSIAGYTAGVVFAESYTSELGNALAEDNPELDFIVIVNALQRSVSYRGIKSNIDLGMEVAALYGGGGHPKASGSRLPQELLDYLTDFYFGSSI